MKIYQTIVAGASSALFFGSSMNYVAGQVEAPVQAVTESVPYTGTNGDDLLGHLSVPSGDGPFPAIVIVPDWDGVNEYEQQRATLVTEEWGMVGFAADIYGADKQTVDNTTERGELATYYRSNPSIFAQRIQDAVEVLKAHEKVDNEKIAIFGYCFGGSGVLMYGMEGFGAEDIKAVVSFHGGLTELQQTNNTFGPKVLVLSGGDDDMSSDIMELESMLNMANAPWEITRYSGIEHAFTKWSDERYNQWADMRSWESAGHFILEAFGITEFFSNEPVEANVTAVDYISSSDGTSLRGHLAMPSGEWQRPLPAVVIFPDWDGVNEYEMKRATMLAEQGYVAFAADVYGADMQYVESIDDRIAALTKYRTDPELFYSRIQDAIDQVKLLTDDVDSEEIAIIGYCFGGSAVVLYSLSGGTDAKIAIPFHGGLDQLPPVQGPVTPYILVLSGGDDDAHGNQTTMELVFNEGQGNWETTRYAGVLHGYTEWSGDAYNLVADARSWESMMTSFTELLPIPGKAGALDDPCADIARDGTDCTEDEPAGQAANNDSAAAAAVTGFVSVSALAGFVGYLLAV